MKIENITYEFEDGFHQASFFHNGYELAINFTEDKPHAIGDYTYQIDWVEVMKDGYPVHTKVREEYLLYKEELLKRAVKEYLG
jgi:hypothetical protein